MPKKTSKNLIAADQGRADAFESFMSQMAKDRPGEVRALSDNSALKVPVYSTGAISLDVALGVGGIPTGRITEIYGPTGGGKTTLALATAANCQVAGKESGRGQIGFVDAEHALSPELALNIGVDPDRFVVYQPEHGEDAIDMVEKMLTSGAFDMVIVDSVASMTPKAELDAEVEQGSMALHARLMSKFMRRVVAHTQKSECALVLLNQIRSNLGQYGAPETATGGKAIPFYSSVRIEVRTSNSKRITGPDNEFIGTAVAAKVMKNKLASPFRNAEYELIFGKGIDASSSLLAVCMQLGLIETRGATYTDTATGERLAIGKEKTKAAISADPELQQRLTDAVYTVLNDNVITPDAVPDNTSFDEVDDPVGNASIENELGGHDDIVVPT